MQIINSPSYFIWLFFCFSSFSFRERVSVVYILFIEGGYCCRRYMVWETVHVCAAEYRAMACLNAIFKQDGYKTNGTHWAVLLSFFSLSGGFASHFRSTVGIRAEWLLARSSQKTTAPPLIHWNINSNKKNKETTSKRRRSVCGFGR